MKSSTATETATEPLSAALTRQHRQLDAALDAGIERKLGREDLQAMVAALRLHIWIEEEVLFDPLVATGMVMPIYIMQVEHAEMWTLLDQLECLQDLAHAGVPCRTLRKLTGLHDRKEEDLVYAAVDQLLSGADGARLRAAVAAASVPPGWVCRGRRADFAPPPGAPPWPPGGRVV